MVSITYLDSALSGLVNSINFCTIVIILVEYFGFTSYLTPVLQVRMHQKSLETHLKFKILRWFNNLKSICKLSTQHVKLGFHKLFK